VGEPEEEAAAAKVESTAVDVAAALEQVAEEVAARLGEQISAALVAAAKQVEVAVEMVKVETAARQGAMRKERSDRHKGLLWVAAPIVLALVAALFAIGGYLSVRHEADLRADALCRQQNATNAGVLTLLNGLLALGQKRDSTLPPERLPAVEAARAESRALGARTLPQVPC